MSTVIIALALLAIGLFALKKMLTVKPHKLKKEIPYCVVFQKEKHGDILGEELVCFAASKSNLVGCVIGVVLLGGLIAGGIATEDKSFFLYTVPAVVIFFVSLQEGTKKVHIYQHGVVVASVLQKKTYWYHDLDSIESYNVVNSFHKGISYGYQFRKGNDSILSMDIRNYPAVEQIESVFGESTIVDKWKL